ncbi:MAG TPA: VOC family protein, partial [Candidatus Polarisedimenticolia bacterium]|nr:VOC family protein [Candidatus Polarisedimenticolia bacterium]
PVEQLEGVINLYQSGGKWFSIYSTRFAGTAKNTVAGWRVKDLRAEVAALRQRGVVFEDYDFPEFKTEDGIFASPEGDMSAWFVDSEGNTVAINEDADSSAG